MGWFDDKKGNPLDKFFTWGAETFLPTWCSREDHWTARVTDYFFTDCPCCILWRGLSFGFVVGAACGLGIGVVAF